jgi:hypothetical protein
MKVLTCSVERSVVSSTDPVPLKRAMDNTNIPTRKNSITRGSIPSSLCTFSCRLRVHILCRLYITGKTGFSMT